MIKTNQKYDLEERTAKFAEEVMGRSSRISLNFFKN